MNKTLILACLYLPALAGCLGSDAGTCGPASMAVDWDDARHDVPANAKTAYIDMGFDGDHWPDLSGHTLHILDHGAFQGYAYEPAKAAFENLTGATVTATAADDAGTALQLAIQDRLAGCGSFDILYGVDNVLMKKAVDGGIFDPYTPLLGARVADAYRFVPTVDSVWLATPVDVGFIAVNGDANKDVTLTSWSDLVQQADQFVTSDPRFSSPGLGFLLATVAAFGEDGYLAYWGDLLGNGLLVTSGWGEAYGQHFSGGFGQYEPSNPLDRALVTSYTTSPAFEMYYGYDAQNDLLLAPGTTFRQIQTMGILHGADRAVAEAWIEFTLTDDFQRLEAPWNAIYPVVSSPAVDARVREVFGDIAPEPGSFEPTALDSTTIGAHVDDWVRDWTDLYESHQIR